MTRENCVVERVTERPPHAYPLRVQYETCIFPIRCWSLREPARRVPLWGCTTPWRFHACGPSGRMAITIEGAKLRGARVDAPRLLQGAEGAWPEWCVSVRAREADAPRVIAFLEAANQGNRF